VGQRSNGSIYVRWSVTRSGSTRNRHCRSPSWPTFTLKTSMPGSRVTGRRDPRTCNGIPDSKRAGGKRGEYRIARPLPGAGLVCAQSARRVPSAGPRLTDAARTASVASSGTATRGTHRPLPGGQHDFADPADAFGAWKRTAVQRTSGVGHDDVLGRPQLHSLFGHARRRRPSTWNPSAGPTEPD